MSKLKDFFFQIFMAFSEYLNFNKYWNALFPLSILCLFYNKGTKSSPAVFFWGSYSICHAGKPIKKSTLIYIRVHHVFLGSRFYWWDHIGNCRGFFAHVAQTLIAFHYISPLLESPLSFSHNLRLVFLCSLPRSPEIKVVHLESYFE